MRYRELEELGRLLTEETAAEELRQLVMDRRFAAVVRLVQQQKELASDGACQLKFAEHAGCLAHAAGVRYGMLELEGRIRTACERKKKKEE